MVLFRKLPALALALCLLAGPALSDGGAGNAACCVRPAARPSCAVMGQGGARSHGAACSLHAGGGPCSMRPADGSLAVLHVHPELAPRPAVGPRPGAVLFAEHAARLPELALFVPASPGSRPETPPPRLLLSLQVA